MADRYVCIYPGSYDYATAGYTYAAGYMSMKAAEAGEGGGTLDADDLYVDILHGDVSDNWDGAPDTAYTNWDGWDCQNGAKVFVRTLTTAQDQLGTSSRPDFSNGTRDTTEYLLKCDDHCLRCDNDHDATEFLDIEFIGIQLETHTTSGEIFYIKGGAKHTSILFKKCWFTQTTTAYPAFWNDENGSCVTGCTNCVFDGGGVANDGLDIAGGTSSDYYINCDVFGWATGVTAGNNDRTVTNCVVGNNTDDWENAASLSGTLNCSDDQDGPGTDIAPDQGADDWTGDLTTPWTNLNVKDTNANIYQTGESQTNDSRVPSDDIAGTARVDGDESIGAFEYVAAGGGLSIPIAFDHLMME